MNCNGTRRNIFVAVYLIIVLLQFATSQKDMVHMDDDQAGDDSQLDTQGNLYDIFKRRLDKIRNELSYDVEVSPGGELEGEIQRYDSDRLNKKRAISDCLYEEFKRRVDKFYNELASNPNKDFKRKIAALLGDNEEKRSTVRECLYEEYKKRLDKINNELALDGEKVFDRSGRSFLDAAKADRRRQPAAKTTQNDPQDAISNAFTEYYQAPISDSQYEDHMARLNKISSALYEKDKLLYDKFNGGGLNQVVDEEDLDTYRVPDVNKLSNPQPDNSQSKNLKFEIDIRYSTQKTDGEKPKTGSSSSSNPQVAGAVVKSKDNLVDERDYTDVDVERGEAVQQEDSQSQLYPAATYGDEMAPYGADIGNSYPAVLTKAFESNMSPVNLSPTNLLASVAKKMNTSTLELAQKLTSMTDLDTASIKNDPKFAAVLQKYISSTVGMDTNITPVVSPPVEKAAFEKPATEKPALEKPALEKPQVTATKDRKPKETPSLLKKKLSKANNTKLAESPDEECEDVPETNATTILPPTDENATCSIPANIGEILEKVLYKLENMQQEKSNATSTPMVPQRPEGTPCDLLGSWNSYEMGLRFDITLAKGSERQLGLAEEGNKLLIIEAQEHIPPRKKALLDTDWKYMGSMLKQLGGPMFIYTQRRPENIVALFTGFCRTCGGMDTIFGSWTFLYPCKDCQDISTSIENHRDIFRRYRMEVKRKQRFKDILFEKSNYGKAQACAAAAKV